jgi:hypothetical protein
VRFVSVYDVDMMRRGCMNSRAPDSMYLSVGILGLSNQDLDRMSLSFESFQLNFDFGLQ